MRGKKKRKEKKERKAQDNYIQNLKKKNDDNLHSYR